MLEHTGLNKLAGFGPVYVINMEKSKDRNIYIQEHFKKYGVEDYSFVKAIDGSSQDMSGLVQDIKSIPISNNEAACSISHLKAIEEWLSTSSSEYAIFVEDDVSFETVDFWNFSWEQFLKSVNKQYDILQLAIINNFMVNPRLHLREVLDWSAAAYLIKRSYAERLIKKHKKNDMYVFSKNRYLAVSEGLLFGRALCYSIPLFTYSLDLGSSLNESHVDTVHKQSKRQTLDYWQKNQSFKLDLV